MCDCINKTEQALKEFMASPKSPMRTAPSEVSCENVIKRISLRLTPIGNGLRIPFSAVWKTPGTKSRKVPINVDAIFCPFCGNRFPEGVDCK